jgi:hypothetical protein
MRFDQTNPKGVMPGGPNPVGVAVVIAAIVRAIIRGK